MAKNRPYRAYDKIMDLLHNQADKMEIPLPLSLAVIEAVWPIEHSELCRLRQLIDQAENAKRVAAGLPAEPNRELGI